MPSTTSLKIPDDLKASIAKVAAREGKTSHALMLETLQTAMDNALVRQQFYAQADAAYQETVRTNVCYDMTQVHAHIRARVQGKKTAEPQAKAFNPAKPMVPR